MINNKLTHRLLHYCNPMHTEFTSLSFDFTLVTSKLLKSLRGVRHELKAKVECFIRMKM